VVISLEMTLCDIYRYGGGCHREWLEIKSKGLLKKLAASLSPFHRAMLRLEKRVFTDTGLKFVAANSRMVKGDILKHYDLPEEKICVIYNGVDLADFDYPDRGGLRRRIRGEVGIADAATVILFVGSGFERKGLATLIRAVGLLAHKEAELKLLVIGRGELSRYAGVARKAGVADRVVFVGPVKGATDYYAAGDIFALPSIYEPFSNACLEAMAAGLPVVTTSRNGASEIIEDGVNGGICQDPSDPQELADKIAPFLDEKKRAEAGPLARAEAGKYPIERNIKNFLSLIEKIK
jgi:UDP-glucose:(heptosyl)LPS alpha-1,3-glucosyltransferase